MKRIIIIIVVFAFHFYAQASTLDVPSQYSTIQSAIDAANGGDSVLVAPGTYLENIDFNGKAISVVSSNGVDVTVIDGNQSGSVVTFQNGEGLDSLLEGFTLTNGSGNWMYSMFLGGGLYIQNSSPSVYNCNITVNTAFRGGGIFNTNSSPIISGCTFTGNSGSDGGGGMIIISGSPAIKDCTFLENTAHYMGGGINNGSSSTTVTNCSFIGNISEKDGGGAISSRFVNGLKITNCVFISNKSPGGGGYYGNTSTITNCTFLYNTGVGLYLCYSTSEITNCILWDNSPKEIEENGWGGAPNVISHSCIKGGYTGTGNIDADPLFVDPTNDDFHLTYNSPCRDTGDSSVVTESYDFEGDPRIALGTVDMGADEFHTHLYVTGDMTPGGSIQGKLVGVPATNPVGLFIGSGVLLTPANTMWGEFYLQAPWFLFYLYPVPSNGILTLPTTLPVTIPAPYDVPMQALIGLNPDSLTNLYVLEVR